MCLLLFFLSLAKRTKASKKKGKKKALNLTPKQYKERGRPAVRGALKKGLKRGVQRLVSLNQAELKALKSYQRNLGNLVEIIRRSGDLNNRAQARALKTDLPYYLNTA